MIGALIADGTIPLLALGLIALEVSALLWLARGRPGLNGWALLANGASGAALLMALWTALRDDPPLAVAMWLAAGFAAHLADLATRWSR